MWVPLGLDTPKKVVIFVGYIFLWCWIRAYIYYSTHDEDFKPYDRAAVVTAVSVCKLTLAIGFFLVADGTASDLVRQCKENGSLFAKYMVLAMLYAAYDNLSLVGLSLLSPYSYQIIMQLRLVTTAILWQLLFRKPLGHLQWIAMIVISAAVAIFNLNEGQSGATDSSIETETEGENNVASVVTGLALRTAGILVSLTQISCAVLAGIFCEYLLKHKNSSTVPLNLQNCFMCVSICRVLQTDALFWSLRYSFHHHRRVGMLTFDQVHLWHWCQLHPGAV